MPVIFHVNGYQFRNIPVIFYDQYLAHVERFWCNLQIMYHGMITK